MFRHTFFLFIMYLMSESRAANSTVEVNIYTKNDKNTGYETKSIIEQMEEISRVECFLKCTRKEGCGHVVVSGGEKRCKLLKAVIILSGMNSINDEGEDIYDLVVDGGYAHWGTWGACEMRCGSGTQKRLRTCSEPAPK